MFPWSLWNSRLNSISSPFGQEIAFICAFSWAKWRFLMSVCLTRDCEMLKPSPLKRACWSAIETIPCVIFFLNTNYSLPDSPLFVSFYSPFSLSLFNFPLSLFLHTRSQAERFPCLFFNGKKMKQLDSMIFFLCTGTLFPKYIVTAFVLNMDKRNCEILSLRQFF